MKGTSILASFILLAGSAAAQSSAWGQCGGINWNGATTCVSGYYCKVTNAYYSQCVPGTAPGSPSSSTTRTPTPTSTTTPVVSPSSTVSVPPANPSATGVLIRGVSSPVYHLYLQASGTTPVLGPEASAHSFVISGSMRDNSNGMYLNIENASTSYKPLIFGTAATFTGWGLEGDTIITSQSSSYGRQLNFLACSTAGGLYRLYLQTGNATPPGESCTLQTIHLPCLC